MYFIDESVRSYMNNIAELPLISRDDEIELAELIERGSETAREQLIVGNLRLVVKIAHDFKSLGVPLADLISEGNIGLMKAVEKFKPGMGAKFSSYGAWWIKQAIRRCVAEQSRVIRIPVQSAVKMYKIQRVAMHLAEELGRVPSEAEIAEAADISPRSVHNLKVAATSPAISLSTSLKDGEGGVLEDMLPDLMASIPGGEMDERDVKNLLEECVEKHLSEREKLIISMRYGLDGGDQHTLDEISELIGRTRERVRQIQHKALKKLSRHLDEIKK
ncbi:RNA polymerase sigma factor RpoD/SigA [Lentisphaera profundi]|uniref:RNA polymerase sigma factor RpoD/SigA n=1 Tax=Lentisphaera profundi TaxID=1658616 RepID=A0ABY7VW16_9BACT|nr:RNA polymerase sigma factor RpoD/SigA [Lentisphaera profundi]WDE97912.1 RNA polymerase sigma factor RpoD/SigA [Lentisphaera profundi]